MNPRRLWFFSPPTSTTGVRSEGARSGTRLGLLTGTASAGRVVPELVVPRTSFTFSAVRDCGAPMRRGSLR